MKRTQRIETDLGFINALEQDDGSTQYAITDKQPMSYPGSFDSLEKAERMLVLENKQNYSAGLVELESGGVEDVSTSNLQKYFSVIKEELIRRYALPRE